MKEIQSGLFPIEEQMPCLPSDIKIGGKYFFPNLLQIAHRFFPCVLESREQEEVAVRVILHSREIGLWVGVSRNLIMNIMAKEYKKEKESIREMQKKILKKYFWLSVVTLGIYKLFWRKPRLIPEKDLNLDAPFSGIHLIPALTVDSAIEQLIGKKMLAKKMHDENGKNDCVLFPTPKLISKILEKQSSKQNS